ncbi:bifunctional riboflavin kinase/FMN adenylyltransferase [Rubritalea halochordaticola]|uniref:Riboflavin biosynthesis protein n=1 Tax=Rubritalea halochordaticola TaxID=714537 RepID=A0ABP9UV23_9BACT
MRVFQDIRELSELDAPLHLALGVFDGVHVGHQEVIGLAVNGAKRKGGLSGVLTFEPHPIRVLAPERAPRRILASIDHKIELLKDIGVDFVCVQKFDKDFAARNAEEFIADLAYYADELKRVAVGEDWVFGRGRSGNIHKLREWGGELGFVVDAAAPVMVDGERVSSTRIRQAIRDGNLQAAHDMLGRQYTVVGTVIEGRKLARSLGFPTANVVAHNEQLPPDGVWALKVEVAGKSYQAIGNLGRRPTVEMEGARRLLEVHVFGFDEDVYGQVIEAEFLDYIRPEKKFDSIEALKAQIEDDVNKVKSTI